MEAFDAFIRGLLAADWESPTGPMRFSSDVTLPELAEAALFQNARVLLAALAAEQGTPSTASGNLNRAFVGRLFDRISLAAENRESILHVCKVINEQDVWPLHLARVVAELARLVARRNRRFRITRAGRELLPDEQAGPLYRRLFLTYFRQFNLEYDFQLRDVPLIQSSIAAILWRLDTVARDWTPVSGLASEILLPQVLQQLRDAMMPGAFDTEEWILGGYVLVPLHDLGLLERKASSDWRLIEKNDKIRITPLWQKFIHFKDWRPSARLN